MCGIIGYVGSRKASEVITEGLKRLEYRGYDSVGIAVHRGGSVEVRKEKGMVAPVSESLGFTTLEGNIALGHTRWATHGAPCKANSHPHSDCTGRVVLAHNGVIENFPALKAELLSRGHRFSSETDSEAVAHLIEEGLRTLPPQKAFLAALNRLHGSFGIVAMIADGKGEELYVARRNSPLVLGVGRGEMFCASDIPAMLKYTKTFVPLEEGDAGVLTRNGYRLFTLDGRDATRTPITVDWNLEMAEKSGYPHFMLKEINDQKHFLNESLAADVTAASAAIRRAEKIDIVACGTSFHAGLLLKTLLAMHMNKRSDAYIASEYPLVGVPDGGTLVVAISQSGETADTLQALKYAKARGAKVLSLANVVGSSITRLSDIVVYLHAGPEICVAATKTFTSQAAVIYSMIFPKEKLASIPGLVAAMLELEPLIQRIAAKIAAKRDIFFIGRGLNYPVAMEGALKLKEISYLHAEAYAGGELKHGPLSLIEDGVPVIALAPSDASLQKIYGNIKEVKARGAYLVALTDDDSVRKEADAVIELPKLADDFLYPFPMTVALQLLAYHVSVLRGIDPDKPRNLAKSVTVE